MGSIRGRGIVLILVLLLVVLISVLVAQFTYTTQIDGFVAENSRGDQDMRLVAQGSVPIARAFLTGYLEALKAKTGGEVFTLHEKTFEEAVKGSNFQIELRPVKDAEPGPEDQAVPGLEGERRMPAETEMVIHIEDSDLGLSIDIADEARRIPINNLLSADRRAETSRHIGDLVGYLRGPGYTHGKHFAEALDPEFPKRLAERFGVAQGGVVPNVSAEIPADRPVTDLSEILALAKPPRDDGLATPDTVAEGPSVLWGGPSADGKTQIPGLASFLTVWGAGGEGRVNVNTARREVLFAVLPARIPAPNQPGQFIDVPSDQREGWADKILARRAERPILKVDEIPEVLGVDAAALFGTQGGQQASPVPAQPVGLAPDQPAQPQGRGLKDMLGVQSGEFTAHVTVKGSGRDEGRTLQFQGLFRVGAGGEVVCRLWDEVPATRAESLVGAR